MEHGDTENNILDFNSLEFFISTPLTKVIKYVTLNNALQLRHSEIFDIQAIMKFDFRHRYFSFSNLFRIPQFSVIS